MTDDDIRKARELAERATPGPWFTGTTAIRRADRDFRVGDVLHLVEWDPQTQSYPGGSFDVRVTYLTRGGEWGLPEGICVMSVEGVR